MQSHHLARVLPAICLLWAIGASPLGAEPIVISSGLLAFPRGGPGTMTLEGEGFSFIGTISSNSNVGPVAACDTRCDAGTTISIHTLANGTVLMAT